MAVEDPYRSVSISDKRSDGTYPPGKFVGHKLIERETRDIYQWDGEAWFRIAKSGAMDIHDADVHNIPINNYFYQTTGTSTTLANPATSQDTDIDVVSAAGFSVGDEIQVNGLLQTTYPRIVAIAVNTITIDRPLDNDHAAGTDVTLITTEMNVVGTLASPEIFTFPAPAGFVFHVTRILISMTHNTGGDLGLFGNQAALTNGLVFRSNISGNYGTFTNWKINADIKNDMYDVEFDTRSGGGGTFGTSGRGSFNRIGVAVRLDGDEGDRMEMLVQDDLSGLVSFRIKAQGHIE